MFGLAAKLPQPMVQVVLSKSVAQDEQGSTISQLRFSETDLICIGGSKGGANDVPPPTGQIIFQFDAAFGKKWPN